MSLSIYPHATLPSPTPTPTHAPTTVLFQGDVPPSVQRQIVGFSDFHIKDVGFARTTGQRLDLKEASVFTRAEDAKLQSRLVYEITVAQDLGRDAPPAVRVGRAQQDGAEAVDADADAAGEGEALSVER